MKRGLPPFIPRHYHSASVRVRTICGYRVSGVVVCNSRRKEIGGKFLDSV